MLIYNDLTFIYTHIYTVFRLINLGVLPDPVTVNKTLTLLVGDPELILHLPVGVVSRPTKLRCESTGAECFLVQKTRYENNVARNSMT